MAAYDSDSSLDDDIDYTLTNVMLGYASVDPSDDDISHIGGHPVSTSWAVLSTCPLTMIFDRHGLTPTSLPQQLLPNVKFATDTSPFSSN